MKKSRLKEDISDDISKQEDVIAQLKVKLGEEESKLADLMKKKAEATKKALEENLLKEDHVDKEGRMAKSQMYKMINYVGKLSQMLDDDIQLPSWVQTKIAKASDYMSAVFHYLDYEMVRSQDNLIERVDLYKKRNILMENVMRKFFDMFDQGMTDEEIIKNFAVKGTQVPDSFVSNVRRNYSKAKELELAMDMGEKEFKNSARDIVNNPEGDTGMEPREKSLASGLFNEKLDPVGQEDDDIDNDGDVDKTDKYLKNKRKAVSKAINKQKNKK